MPTLAKRKAPAELLVTCLVWFVAGFVRESSALGTRAPEASITVPVMVALSWHHAWGASTMSSATRANQSAADRLEVLWFTSRRCASDLTAPGDAWSPKRFIICLLRKRLLNCL